MDGLAGSSLGACCVGSFSDYGAWTPLSSARLDAPVTDPHPRA